MHQAGQFLLGKMIFPLSARHNVNRIPLGEMCIILNVVRKGQYVIVDIQANAFVHHMVRNIVGSLIEVGAGKQPVEWMKWLLEQKDRKLAAPTAKPEGLYLVNVIYPEKFAIPQKI